jgi:hypothetical protein
VALNGLPVRVRWNEMPAAKSIWPPRFELGSHPQGTGRAFVVGVLFLELNGYRFTTSEEAAAQAVRELAAGRIDANGYCEFLRSNTDLA